MKHLPDVTPRTSGSGPANVRTLLLSAAMVSFLGLAGGLYVVPTLYCAGHRGCRDVGKCSYDAWMMECRVMTDGDCRRSRPCRDTGRCSAVGNVCAVTSAADCDASDRCAPGQCDMVDGACWFRDAYCRAQDACEGRGECTGEPYGCGAHSNEDCRRSAWCATRGWCTFDATHPLRCKVGGDADCRHTEGCVDFGWCGRGEDAACAATTDDMCRGSTSCRKDGACFARQGRCIARDEDDCRASTDCRDKGACGLTGETCVPVQETQ
ncbi:MAG: hypothetical protein AAF928_19830 [Myxococcota bacterium]